MDFSTEIFARSESAFIRGNTNWFLYEKYKYFIVIKLNYLKLQIPSSCAHYNISIIKCKFFVHVYFLTKAHVFSAWVFQVKLILFSLELFNTLNSLATLLYESLDVLSLQPRHTRYFLHPRFRSFTRVFIREIQILEDIVDAYLTYL